MEKAKIEENLCVFVQDEIGKLRANTYLLEGDSNILIDAGFYINKKPAIVVLTHCHLDHSFFAEKYQKEGAKIAVGKKDFRELKTASNVVSPFTDRKHFKTIPKPFVPDIKLTEGAKISNSNFNLEVIECPGHTPGSIALWDAEKRILFSGDTWYGKDVIGTWNFPGGDYLQLQKSVEKLKKLKPRIICSGHGAIKWKRNSKQ